MENRVAVPKLHVCMPCPKRPPYFNKASIESGPGVRMTDREIASETTEKLLKELNIDRKDWQKLLEIPAADLLAAQAKFTFVAPSLDKKNRTRGFGPVVDGVVLPHHPFDPTAPEISRNKPLLTAGMKMNTPFSPGKDMIQNRSNSILQVCRPNLNHNTVKTLRRL